MTDPADDLIFTHEFGTEPHPYERGWRVWPNRVEVYLEKIHPDVMKNAVDLRAIKNEYHQPGAASAVLDKIGTWADDLGVVIVLRVKPFTNMGGRLDAEQLQAWYGRHGFVPRRGSGKGAMIRRPDLLGDLFSRGKGNQAPTRPSRT
jgi:hypothetical protein